MFQKTNFSKAIKFLPLVSFDRFAMAFLFFLDWWNSSTRKMSVLKFRVTIRKTRYEIAQKTFGNEGLLSYLPFMVIA